MPRDMIPTFLAIELKAAGLTWQQVADEIKARTGRSYKVDSLAHAVAAHKKTQAQSSS
jgi:hypothetical protein